MNNTRFGITAGANYSRVANAHDPSGVRYTFQGGGCYLLLDIVEVDFHFPTVTIHKMAKMPMILIQGMHMIKKDNMIFTDRSGKM